MGPTNFDLGPPPKVVGGIVAVPIDIQRITAQLRFDGATQTGQGDATIEFVVGPLAGHPIFDLRQTVTAAWLDGAPVPAADVAHRDFGGGPHAELRVLASPLAAGSAHTLRLTYSLGPPQASLAGSYPPAIVWSAGPRLTFNFGFTDLGAGRYLEAWIPANLIFDQFELSLELWVENTPIAHTPITNGEVTLLGANHWRVAFPPRFTASSPLLELRSTDTLVSAVDSTLLPVSGANVQIEAWKLATSAVSLPSQVANIKTFLAANEVSTGPYMHGSRFVAFLHAGGMEYEGGTTTGTGPLRHETFHSWWARGVKPASQPDAWFDEAWTVYNDQGAMGALPFNFADPPITLCPQNPWVRVTAANSYSDGFRFWQGIAALLGAGTLTGLMSEFYLQRRHRPATTSDIETFLLGRTGNASIVDAFHSFVYGLDGRAVPDVWLRDDDAHAGADAWSGRFWDSPDLWVRNVDDGFLEHQPPEHGQDNWLYARVRNRGAEPARHFVVTFNVKTFAGTGFVYPADFFPCIAAASGFDLAPGATVVVKARWPRGSVPAPGTHPCLTAAVFAAGDHPSAGLHVWEDNNLAQKNLTVVDAQPNAWILIPFVASNLRLPTARRYQLELTRPERQPDLQATLLQRAEQPFVPTPGVSVRPFKLAEVPTDSRAALDLDCGGREPPVDRAASNGTDDGMRGDRAGLPARWFPSGVEATFPPGRVAAVPVSLRARDQLTFGLRLRAPNAPRSGTFRLDLVQRDVRTGRIVGGIAVELRIR